MQSLPMTFRFVVTVDTRMGAVSDYQRERIDNAGHADPTGTPEIGLAEQIQRSLACVINAQVSVQIAQPVEVVRQCFEEHG